MTPVSKTLTSTALLSVLLLNAGCAVVPASPQPGQTVRMQGTVLDIDTQPWTYDGHAILRLQSRDDGVVQVQLPARWNLCQAAPVDANALAVGDRVSVVGTLGEDGAVLVCQDASHHVVPLR